VLLAGYGIFAEGPTSILNGYVEVLEKHGIGCHLSDATHTERRSHVIALLMSKGYVISEYMTADQIL
jgi:hypothetical protein